MTALDALFVPNRRMVLLEDGTIAPSEGNPRERRLKRGEVIARELTAKWLLPGWDAQKQQTWITNLYSVRNKAIHEGRSFHEELQIDDLLPLVRLAVIRGAWHLGLVHRGRRTRGACSDIDAVRKHEQRIEESGHREEMYLGEPRSHEDDDYDEAEVW